MLKLRTAIFSLLIAACGSSNTSDSQDSDASPEEVGVCRNGVVEGTEECDDFNDTDEDSCLNDCTFACGDGVRNASELCDTGIAADQSDSCPTDCNDGDACTADVVSGDACQTMCLNATISAFVNDDGCCPVGADSAQDNDCTSVCGNSLVEAGETCDTAITSGIGACDLIADCEDSIACTADTLLNPGTCAALCENATIAATANDDGCCPANATNATDNDCPADCGDGAVTDPETCDTAIANSCPVQADCVDGDACTQDLLISDGTCVAECQNPVISTILNGDSCCPVGANANNDDDCAPVCNNSVVEFGEECDDGNNDVDDGCDANCQNEVVVPTAFRVNNIDLREPHAFASVFGCNDITNGIFGQGINPTFDDNTNGDADGDGFLDLNIAQVFRPLNQSLATNTVEAHFPDCTDPVDTSTCTSTTSTPQIVTATNQSTGTCLVPVVGTTGPSNMGNYSPAPTTPSGPCYVTSPDTLVIDVDGMVITLEDAQFGATYVGNAATTLTNGLLIGFLSEANADLAIIPDVPFVGGQLLSSVLPGGTGSCKNDPAAKDIGPNGTTGWWMALNFQANVVPWTDLP